MKLQWGIIGAGGIARRFAAGLAASDTSELLAVGSRTEQGANTFGEEFGISRRYHSYQALLADPDVQAAYIATPHPMHAEWAVRAAESGKHILCEKPLTLNHASAMGLIEAAREHDVFLMEAYMYRCHPQTAKIVELIREGAIGRVGVIQATFSFQAGFDPEARLFNQALGGGGILDVGGYCTSFARLVAGAANGKDFAEPLQVTGAGHLGESRVDDYAVATLRFPGDVLAQVATGVNLNQENTAHIFGSEGSIYLPSPWIPGPNGEPTSITLFRNGKEPEEIRIESGRPLYTIEADTVAANIERRQAPSPAMTWEDTLGNLQTQDAWREAIGLVYDLEQPGGSPATVSGRPLAKRADTAMTYGHIAGVEKPVSRLIMGCDNQVQYPHAQAMFDDYFEQGGNGFDTSYIYGGGIMERLLGQWITARGVREQVVVIGKGVHTPDNFPEKLMPQLQETLARLGTDHVDIYVAHRDNPEVPVEEWAEAFHEAVKAGLAHAYGGSNWELTRVAALNKYAKAKGLTGMACVSNNFSLARMVNPVWSGCIASSDEDSRRWLTKTQLPLLAWSSQARGFFTGRAHPDKRSDESLVNSWYAEDNFQRKARAEELAASLGVAPIDVALAYVLCQPFPTFALIGPRLLSELRVSLKGGRIKLTPEQAQWLNLER